MLQFYVTIPAEVVDKYKWLEPGENVQYPFQQRKHGTEQEEKHDTQQSTIPTHQCNYQINIRLLTVQSDETSSNSLSRSPSFSQSLNLDKAAYPPPYEVDPSTPQNINSSSLSVLQHHQSELHSSPAESGDKQLITACWWDERETADASMKGVIVGIQMICCT